MSATCLDALSAIIAAGKLSAEITDKKDRELIKNCVEYVFKSIMEENVSRAVAKEVEISLNLTEEEYAILATMVKKGKKYTNVAAVAKSVYGSSKVSHDSVLPVLRRFLRNNSSPVDPCEIEIAQKRSRKAADQYRIKIGSLDRVKELLSDPCYSNFPVYTNYKLQPSLATKTKVTKARTHAELERDIIAAIPYAKNIKHICDVVGRVSSGSMYRLIKSILIRHDLQIGSKYDIGLPMANIYQSA